MIIIIFNNGGRIMKPKILKPMLAVALILVLVTVFASCAKEEKTLVRPRKVVMEGETLSWEENADASGYEVEVDGEIYETETNSFSLFLIAVADREYEIRVRAYSEKSGYKDSEWSKVVTYTPKLVPIAELVFEADEKGTGSVVSADPEKKPVGKLVIPGNDPATGRPVTEVKKYAFNKCDELTGVIIPDSVETIESYAFQKCTSLADVKLSKCLKKIGIQTFDGCSLLTKIDLPDTLERIDPNAFSGTAISSMNFPAGVEEIGHSIFGNCPNLISITVDEKNEYFYSENNCIMKRSDNSLCVGIKTSVIPDHVTKIGNGAFDNIVGLTEIEIPANVKEIGWGFLNCPDLVSVKLNEGLKSLGTNGFEGWAFGLCNKLQSLHIPASVEFIAKGTGTTCQNLTDLTIDPANKFYKSENGGIIRLSDSALIGSCGATDYVPEGVKIIDSHAFGYHRFRGKLVIPEGVERINTLAFESSSIESVVMPDSLKEIEVDAFYDCVGPKYVELPVGVILRSDKYGDSAIPSMSRIVYREKKD